MSAAQPRDSLAGQRINNYEILERLGAGGMGVVYKARDLKLGRAVALKFLGPQLIDDDISRGRMLQEAQAASALDHNNIGVIHGLEEDPAGRMFIVMGFYEGETLSHRIQRSRPALPEALDIAIQMARGLAAAHAKRIVHRDIKPANAIITPDGIVKILDFGLAKLHGFGTLTATNTTGGTVAYMSPEQAQGKPADSRSDIWALGIVLYEMLSGRQPFRGESVPSILYAVVHTQPDPLAQVPAEVARVVAKALAKQPDARYQHVEEIVKELESLRSGAAPEAFTQTQIIPLQETVHPSLPPASTKPLWRRRRIWAVTALALSVVAIARVPAARERLPDWLGGTPRQRHIAVLPFNNVGGDPANAALCDGLVETLTSRITTLEHLQKALWVVPSSEVRRRNVSDAAEARRSFGANLVVTGSVQRQGNRLRLIINLIDAAASRQVGSAVYDDPAADFSAAQDMAIVELAKLLELEVNPRALSSARQERTVAPPVYEAYLKALGQIQRYDKPGNLDSAIALFEQASRSDPRFAAAIAGLGEAHRLKFSVAKDAAAIQRAAEETRRALAINANLPAAHVTLGRIHESTGQRDLAVQEFQRAIELDFRNADALRGLARVYEALGRLPQAEAEFHRAIALRPDYSETYNSLALFYNRHGRYSEAEKQLRQVLEFTPDNAVAYSNLGVILMNQEKRPAAVTAMEKSISLSPSYFGYLNLANLYYADGRYARAAELYDRAVKLTGADYRLWGSFALASHWAGFGETKTRPLFERAAQMAEEHLRTQPGDAEAHSLLGYYYARLGLKDKAAEALQKALSLTSANSDVLTVVAEAYQVLGMKTQAREWLLKAIEKGYSLEKLRRNPELRGWLPDAAFQPKPK